MGEGQSPPAQPYQTHGYVNLFPESSCLDHLVLVLVGLSFEVVSETRLLGLIVQSDLGWQSQINDMVSKQ